jgi:hypothetical protein
VKIYTTAKNCHKLKLCNLQKMATLLGSLETNQKKKRKEKKKKNRKNVIKKMK